MGMTHRGCPPQEGNNYCPRLGAPHVDSNDPSSRSLSDNTHTEQEWRAAKQHSNMHNH